MCVHGKGVEPLGGPLSGHLHAGECQAEIFHCWFTLQTAMKPGLDRIEARNLWVSHMGAGFQARGPFSMAIPAH